MPELFIIFSFILGTIIGSFLNVVALRYNTGMTLKGRSKCFSCGKSLEWHELVPIVSFLFQRGECKKCQSKISFQYPIVEFFAGIIFVLIFYFFPPMSLATAFITLFYLFITCLLLVITIYDIKHKIIPDPLVYTFAAVALVKLFFSVDVLTAATNTFSGIHFILPSISALLAGPILALPFFLIWLFSKGTWMGLGDAKLVLGIGWVLGLVSGLSAIILAFWIGAVVSIIWMYIVFKKVKEKYEIPFGPYLILGMYIILFSGITIIDFAL